MEENLAVIKLINALMEKVHHQQGTQQQSYVAECNIPTSSLTGPQRLVLNAVYTLTGY